MFQRPSPNLKFEKKFAENFKTKISKIYFSFTVFGALAHRSCMPSFVGIRENCKRSSDLKRSMTTGIYTHRRTSITDTISSSACKTAVELKTVLEEKINVTNVLIATFRRATDHHIAIQRLVHWPLMVGLLH